MLFDAFGMPAAGQNGTLDKVQEQTRLLIRQRARQAWDRSKTEENVEQKQRMPWRSSCTAGARSSGSMLFSHVTERAKLCPVLVQPLR